MPLTAAMAIAGPWMLRVLKSKTLWYTIGLTAIVSTIFVSGCNYGAKGKAALQSEFNQYKVTAALMVKSIQDEGKKNAIQTNEKLKAEERDRENLYKKHSTELAKLDRQLDSVKLDLALVQLLNDSAAGTRKDQSTTGPTERADGAANERADSSAAYSSTIKEIRDDLVSLRDLAEIILINNKNHHACADQVEAWQKFYIQTYESFD